MSKSYKEKAITGVYWMALVSIATIIIKSIIIIVLSRLLSPYEFGVVAAIQIVITFADIFWMMGVGPAIVQKKVLTTDDIATGNILNIIFGIIIYCIIFLFSTKISIFLGIENSTMLKVLSIVFVINSISGVSESLLQKEMNFKYIGVINVISLLIYGFSATLFAILNYGAWSLVIGQLSQASIKSLLLIYKIPMKISYRFNIKSAKALMYFGIGFTLSRIFNNIANQGDYLVVNRMLGSSALGLYNRAYQLLMIPTDVIGTVMDKVLFPLLSKYQSRNDKLAYVYLNITSLVAIISFPIMTICLISGADLVTIILGGAWGQTIIPFKILVISLFFRIGYKICDALVRSVGAVYKRLWIQIVYAATVIFGAYIGSDWGINGVAVAISFAIMINYIIMSLFIMYIIRLRLTLLIRYLAPIILVSCFVGMISYFASLVVSGIHLSVFRILIMTLVVGLIYLITVKYLLLRLMPFDFNEFLSTILRTTVNKIVPKKSERRNSVEA